MPRLRRLSAMKVILCPGASWQEPAESHSGGVQTSRTPVFNTLQYVVVVLNFYLNFYFPLFFGMVMLLMNLKQRKNLTATWLLEK